MISSATEPATAAIGVMNSGWNFWTARSMRFAVGPANRRGVRTGRLPQLRQLGDQFFEDRLEAGDRRLIGGAALRLAAERLDDQVDRAVVEMQPPAVGEPGDLRAVHDSVLAAGPSCCSSGHGLPDGAGADRRSFRYSPPLASTSSSERIASTWPPSRS